MRRMVCVLLLVTAFAALGLNAQKPNQSTAEAEPLNVCSSVYNPTIAFTVPPDRRLIIEDATVSASLDLDEIMVGLIETTVGGQSAEHYAGSISGADFRFMRDGRTMKVYADPDTDVIVKAARRNSPTNMEICFSGRLEPLAQ